MKNTPVLSHQPYSLVPIVLMKLGLNYMLAILIFAFLKFIHDCRCYLCNVKVKDQQRHLRTIYKTISNTEFIELGNSEIREFSNLVSDLINIHILSSTIFSTFLQKLIFLYIIYILYMLFTI
jgi:hypothetical protein